MGGGRVATDRRRGYCNHYIFATSNVPNRVPPVFTTVYST